MVLRESYDGPSLIGRGSIDLNSVCGFSLIDRLSYLVVLFYPNMAMPIDVACPSRARPNPDALTQRAPQFAEFHRNRSLIS